MKERQEVHCLAQAMEMGRGRAVCFLEAERSVGEPPVLAYPDAEGQFHLHTDVSYKGL